MQEQQHARILLVCRANMARSPLAAALLDKALTDAGASGYEVASAGVQAVEGAPAAHGTVVLAAERGLDLEGHRSRPVTPELVGGADLVTTMSQAHRDTCARPGPGWARGPSRCPSSTG